MGHAPHTVHETVSIVQDFNNQYPDGVVIIRGATATGKTSLSVSVAEHMNVEVISADSRQVYKGMNIATDTVEPRIRDRIPHHMIDIIDPDESFSVGEWKQRTRTIIPQIQSRDAIPMIVGGTGLYIDSVYRNLSMPDVIADRDLRNQWEAEELVQPGLLHRRLMEIDPDEAMKHPPQNIRFIIRALEIYEKTGQTKTTLATPCPPERPLLMIGIRRDKESTNRLINRRIHQMRNNGLAEEAQRLLDEGYDSELNSMRGIGYGEVIPYLQDEYDRDRAIELMKRHTHRLAKKQRTWFRKYLADAKTSTDPRIQHHIISLEGQA